MSEPLSPLVHTDEGASDESMASEREGGSSEPASRSASSSAEERPVHTGEVVGSNPSSRTAADPIAEMLADEAWRWNVEGRFWPKVMKPLDWDACWLWQGGKKGCSGDGYGNFKLKSYLSARANRISWALYHNRSPGEMFVLHSCDNPPCVNPAHLRLGTVQDNSDDMVERGRWRGPESSKGEDNGAAKLSAADVSRVRDLITAGLTNVAIAAQYGVTHQLISRIRRGRSWGGEPMQPKYASLRR